jgi:putative protease
VEKASNNPTSKERVLEQLTKTGSTVFEFDKLDIDMDDNLFISIKEINELRRIALEKLAEVRKIRININKREDYKRDVPSFIKEFNKNIYIKTQRQYEKIKNDNYVHIYADLELYNKLEDDRLILKLPRVITRHEEYNVPLLVGEMGSVNKYKNIYTDFSLNVVNSYSIALLHSLGVKQITISYELDDNQIKEMINGYEKRYQVHPNLEMIVYAKEEIMISKFNLLKYYKLNNNGYLEDRFNNLYKIVEDNGLMYIYNYMPKHLNNLNYYSDLGVNNFRYNIVDEEDLNNII